MIDWLRSHPELWTRAWLIWAILFLVIEFTAIAFHNGRTLTAHTMAIFGLGEKIPGVRLSLHPWLLAAILVVVAAHFFGLLGRLFK